MNSPVHAGPTCVLRASCGTFTDDLNAWYTRRLTKFILMLKEMKSFKLGRLLNYVFFTQILIILGQILSGMVEI